MPTGRECRSCRTARASTCTGGTVPRQGGIILNLSRMNKILAVDADNWSCVIEPGVTARQLQDELDATGCGQCCPSAFIRSAPP